LTKALGGPEIWIKRDDCTGLALGGNKARKLEFLLAEARGAEADTLVTVGAPQSNHVRMTAAAACVAGLDSLALLFPATRGRSRETSSWTGCSESVWRLSPSGSRSPAGNGSRRVRGDRTTPGDEGRKGLFHPRRRCFTARRPSAISVHRGARRAGPARGLRHRRADRAVRNGRTLAGILVGIDALRLDWNVTGISVAPSGAWEQAGVSSYLDLAREAAGALGMEFRLPRIAMKSCTTMSARPTAYRLRVRRGDPARARSDGILLDPVYTGKAMAGLIALVRAGRIKKGQTVVFLHTGGSGAVRPPEVANL